MGQIIPIYIPTYISNASYAPARVLPRIFFYNGQIDCETFYVKNENNSPQAVDKFPYFDNYNVVSGSFPTDGSKSLLFNNEAPVYGVMPSSSLYTEYWEKYVSLLYDPRTRLLTAKAIIPLADYVKMELNDVVNFRGNYYHLRAINNYSLKTGDCELQLLGPIIADTFFQKPPPPPPPPISSSVYWLNITDNDATSSFKIYDNGTLRVNSSTTQGGTLSVLSSRNVNAELSISPFPGEGTPTMSLFVNGGATIAVSSSLNTTLTASFFTTAGVDYYITASVDYTIPPKTRLSWSFSEGSETTASFTIYESSSVITTLTSSASGNTLLTPPKIVKVELGPESGTYKLGTTMSLFVNGDTTLAVSSSANTTISASFTSSIGSTYYITGSSTYNRPPNPIVSWSFTEGAGATGSFRISDGPTNIVTLTANGSGNSFVTESNTIKVELNPVSGSYKSGTSMSINVNGDITLAVSGTTDTTISASFTGSYGQVFYVTGSIIYNAPSPYNYVTGSTLIFDFGNPASYPGSGSYVYDVSGNGITGSFFNGPTYSTVKGGSLSFNRASSQRIEYSGLNAQFSASYTVQAFFQLSGSNLSYPVIGGQKDNNGVALGIDTLFPPTASMGVFQVWYYGASGTTSSGARNNASASPNVIPDNFTLFSATNNGSSSQAFYVNTGSVSTSSHLFDRTTFTPTNQTVFIGKNPEVNEYINGKLVAWLVYPRVLTQSEITQNFNIFNSR